MKTFSGMVTTFISLNGKDLAGVTQSEVEQQVASIPRGLVRLVVTATPPGVTPSPDEIDLETGR